MELLKPEHFRGEDKGRPIGLYTLRSSVLEASWCNHGARLLQLIVPDRHGRPRDVVLGYDSLAQLCAGLPSMGAFIGRVANRIQNASFTHQQQVCRLPANDGTHCLHGGPGGSRYQVFDVLHHDAGHLVMAWTFRQADDGFPGHVQLRVDMRIRHEILTIDYVALVQDAPTPLNFTYHPFFNLDGESSSSVLDHHLQIFAERFVPVDSQRIPLGQLVPVSGTAFDFRASRTIRDALRSGDPQVLIGQHPDVDHAFVTPSTEGVIQHQARLYSPNSGIWMDVWSDAPALQVYSCGGMDGTLPQYAGKHGAIYRRHAAVCLEPQRLPDAPNQIGFGKCVWVPGNIMRGRIEYRFSHDASGT
jgi:aldose 1-epimerase